MASAITEIKIKGSVPPCLGSVQRDYMQLSVVFIPVELGQRCSFSGIIENNSMPVMPTIPALFCVRRPCELAAFWAIININFI